MLNTRCRTFRSNSARFSGCYADKCRGPRLSASVHADSLTVWFLCLLFAMSVPFHGLLWNGTGLCNLSGINIHTQISIRYPLCYRPCPSYSVHVHFWSPGGGLLCLRAKNELLLPYVSNSSSYTCITCRHTCMIQIMLHSYNMHAVCRTYYHLYL